MSPGVNFSPKFIGETYVANANFPAEYSGEIDLMRPRHVLTNMT